MERRGSHRCGATRGKRNGPARVEAEGTTLTNCYNRKTRHGQRYHHERSEHLIGCEEGIAVAEVSERTKAKAEYGAAGSGGAGESVAA